MYTVEDLRREMADETRGLASRVTFDRVRRVPHAGASAM